MLPGTPNRRAARETELEKPDDDRGVVPFEDEQPANPNKGSRGSTTMAAESHGADTEAAIPPVPPDLHRSAE